MLKIDRFLNTNHISTKGQIDMNEFDIAVLSDALEKATKQYEGMILDQRTVNQINSCVNSVVRDAVEKGQFDPEVKVRAIKCGKNAITIVATPKFVEYSVPCTHPDLDSLMDGTDDTKIRSLVFKRLGDSIGFVVYNTLKGMLGKLGNPPFSHLRIAVLDDTDTLQMFLQARGRCCEIEEDFINHCGKTIAIGFNHGHTRKA